MWNKMETKQRLIRESSQGLLALAELEISRLEESNQQLKSQFDEDESAVPRIDRNFHEEIGRKYDAIVKMYGDFNDNLKPVLKYTERYRKAKEERMILLIAYQDRRRDLAVATR